MNESKITQAQLQSFYESQHKIKEFKSKLKEIEESHKKSENILIRLLETNTPIEDGLLTAIIKITSRTNVAWKEKFIEILGENTATKIQETTVPTTYKSIEVSLNFNQGE